MDLINLGKQNVSAIRFESILKNQESISKQVKFFLDNFNFDGYLLLNDNFCIPALEYYPWSQSTNDDTIDEVEEFYNYLNKNGKIISQKPFIWLFEHTYLLDSIWSIMVDANDFVFFKSKENICNLNYSSDKITLSDFSHFGIRYYEDYNFTSFYISK